jgi:ssDNA-specific exonuclease RecJ
MKKINEISFDSQDGSFKKSFTLYRTLLRIKLLLPPRLREAVLFSYIKNKTLFFALNHPGMVMEFNYNLSLIKDVLKKFDFEGLSGVEIKDVKCFVSNKIPKREEIDESQTYTEHSKGEFVNHVKDSELHQKIEELREIICSHKD